MKQIQKFLNILLPADKARHAFWCTILFLFATLFVATWWALAITLVFATLWELAQDLFENGKTEWQDIFYGLILPTIINLIL